jgi:hypothetical protein
MQYSITIFMAVPSNPFTVAEDTLRLGPASSRLQAAKGRSGPKMMVSLFRDPTYFGGVNFDFKLDSESFSIRLIHAMLVITRLDQVIQ